MLLGDFNAWTKALSDLVVGDKCESFTSLHDVKVDEDIAGMVNTPATHITGVV